MTDRSLLELAEEQERLAHSHSTLGSERVAAILRAADAVIEAAVVTWRTVPGDWEGLDGDRHAAALNDLRKKLGDFAAACERGGKT